MCGIIAAFNTRIKKELTKDKKEIQANEVNDFVIEQYQNQYTRGQRGFGIIRIDSKKKIEIDRSCEPTKFILDLYMKKSSMIIAHHRTPTSTENTMGQAHPMTIKSDTLKFDYHIIHNGIISNDDELRLKHLELGFTYSTEYLERSKYNEANRIRKWNDSEAIAIEIALFIEGKISAIGTENNAAFVALQVDKKTHIAKKVFFGKNGEMADLNMSKTRGKLRISSEGEGSTVKPNELYSFSIDDKDMVLKHKAMPFKKKEIVKIEAPKTTAPINLPISQTIGEEKKTKTVPYRTWVKEVPEDNQTSYTDMPEYAGSDYIKNLCIDFKEKLKEADSIGVTHLIDDSLDEEMEKVWDIVLEYKNILLTDVLEEKEEQFYSEQLKRILIGMKAITNIADKDYDDKERAEEDFESYNETGYTLTEKGKEAIGYTVNGKEKQQWLGHGGWNWDRDDLMEEEIAAGRHHMYENGYGPRE